MIEQLRSPSGSNYSYIIHEGKGGEAILVDPVAVSPVHDYLEDHSLTPKSIINTHGHGDHTGGNTHFTTSETQIICHQQAKSNIANANRTVVDGDSIYVGNIETRVLHTPGHTDGSICVYAEEALISGDTVFLSGCGNPKFGGNTRKLFESFEDKIKPLPDSTILFPGHDYAQKNLRFARKHEPDNKSIDQKLTECKKSNTEPQSTMGEEKKYNPFLRYDKLSLRKNIDGLSTNSSNWDVFKTLRELRNNW